MFGEVKIESRKRNADEPLLVPDLSQKENVFKPPEKRVRPAQKVCLKCLAGEGGHITHVLSDIPKFSVVPTSFFRDLNVKPRIVGNSVNYLFCVKLW